MFCQNCGKELLYGARFCSYCGKEVLNPNTKSVNVNDNQELLDVQILKEVLAFVKEVEKESTIVSMCRRVGEFNTIKSVFKGATDIVFSLGIKTVDVFSDIYNSTDGFVKILKEKYGIGVYGVDFLYIDKKAYLKKAKEIEAELKKYIENNSDLMSYIPSRYMFSEGIEYLITLIEEGRATTRNQALDYLDEMMHRHRVEQGVDVGAATTRAWDDLITTLQIMAILK